MKIQIFTFNRIYSYSLPQQISGTYRFDCDEQEATKLVNVKAIDGQWFFYSTENVKVWYNGQCVDSVPLNLNSFYVFERNNVKYNILVSSIYDNTYTKYSIDNQINLLITNDSTGNLVYNLPVLTGNAKLYNDGQNYIIEKSQEMVVYINNYIMSDNIYNLRNGDKITIYSLNLILFNNILFINNPNNSVLVNVDSANMNIFSYDLKTDEHDVEIKDEELYTESDYFYKSPRLRRMIEEKEFKIQSPPPKQNLEDIPIIYTIGPMITTGMTSAVMLANTLSRISSGETTFKQSWTQVVIGCSMLLTTILWPNLNKRFQKKMKKRREKERLEKYGQYLAGKKNEIEEEFNLQKNILMENLVSLDDCYDIIKNKRVTLWGKRVEQEDFLSVRIGVGNVPLRAKINYSVEDFSMEEDTLKNKVSDLVEKYKIIPNVPFSYSFVDKKITAIMGKYLDVTKFMESVMLQIMAFHSYDDVKIVVLTDKNNCHRWDYLKQLQHCFDDLKQVRFFATNSEEIKNVSSYLEQELYSRLQTGASVAYSSFKPYYLIVTDSYNSVKRTNLFKTLIELDVNYGFSLVVLENLLSRIPSKCDNFISIDGMSSYVLESAYEQQRKINFNSEINYSIDMYDAVASLANIPIEIADDNKNLPDSLGFLEMYNVGRVDQLNILNRWKMNDPTKSLYADVGVDVTGELLNLDIHEKFHGPHGLIAGMTGSGKSEFIITYVLSLAINYSPEEVSFILIDYKGGGLAGAFENKKTGFKLPHLAGTITNLDKAEMNRTLVSIDSEVRRRQQIFNDARDQLNESTMDIYKYQGFYREGRVKEPLSHLLIICDEFAELKSQQPDFMDNLISVARIGRSLGVHLILATQKPSGVVNDQIWSNTKFRVCLKVQDKSDSNEMLKRPEAAELKQAGRFYLQVGYNEYFVLGQSAYSGSKYFPSDEIVKTVDKSINFINNFGMKIKNIEASNNKIKKIADGEQLSAVLEHIVEVAKKENLFAQKLWLDSLSDTIYVDALIQKYNLTFDSNDIFGIIGEFDDPENQTQGILKVNLDDKSNILVYGVNENDREMFISSLIYSTLNYLPDVINYYIIDYGSEQLRNFIKFPHIGDMVFVGEDEKLVNLFKMLQQIINERKKVLIDYGGEFKKYLNAGGKMPIINFIINNIDAFLENHNDMDDMIIKIARDGQRCGINTIITASSVNAIRGKIRQNFNNIFAMTLNDKSDYNFILGAIKSKYPKDLPGRGLFKDIMVHEFQTSIVADVNSIQQHLDNKLQILNSKSNYRAKKIPTLPDIVDYNYVSDYLTDLSAMPIGVGKQSLELVTFNFIENFSSLVLANSLVYTKQFMKSLIDEFLSLKNTQIFVIDSEKMLPELKDKVKYYYNGDFENVISSMNDYVLQIKSQSSDVGFNTICVILGLEKFKDKVDSKKLEDFTKNVKSVNKFNLVIADDYKKVKKFEFDNWYRNILNNSVGIWVGSGLSEQNVFRLVKLTRNMQENYKNNYGWYFRDNRAELIKLIEFEKIESRDDDE